MSKNLRSSSTLAKYLGILALTLLGIPLLGEEIIFENYSNKSGNFPVYTNKPLKSGYTKSWKNTLVGNGKKWSMQSSINKIAAGKDGDLIFSGSTKLQNNSVLYGYTGGSFLSVKDEYNNPIFLASLKNGQPVPNTLFYGISAKTVGWGVNPAKNKLKTTPYYKTYKFFGRRFKIKLWKFKFVTSPKIRNINWQIQLPSYVLKACSNKPVIEIINAHTPTERVLSKLKEISKYITSFIIENGLETKQLYEKAQAKQLTYSDFHNYMNNLLDWANGQNLIDNEKYTALVTIVNSVGTMVTNGTDGLLPSNQMDLVQIAVNIQAIISNKNFNADNVNNLLGNIESLLNNREEFIPSSLSAVENILISTKILVSSKLNSEQEQIFDIAISYLSTVNSWGNEPVAENLDIAFDGLRMSLNIYKSVKDKTITPAYVETALNQWLDKVQSVMLSTTPEKDNEIAALRNIINNVFVVIKSSKSGWQMANLYMINDIIKIAQKSIQGKSIDISTILDLQNKIETLINNSGGWHFDNSNALLNIAASLQELCPNNEQINTIINFLESIVNSR